jgi:Myb/SANT-like DNA-binding domain
MKFIADGNKKISWKRLAPEMHKRGVFRSQSECRNRFQTLQNTYLYALSKNAGAHPHECLPFIQLLMNVMGAYSANK